MPLRIFKALCDITPYGVWHDLGIYRATPLGEKAEAVMFEMKRFLDLAATALLANLIPKPRSHMSNVFEKDDSVFPLESCNAIA